MRYSVETSPCTRILSVRLACTEKLSVCVLGWIAQKLLLRQGLSLRRKEQSLLRSANQKNLTACSRFSRLTSNFLYVSTKNLRLLTINGRHCRGQSPKAALLCFLLLATPAIMIWRILEQRVPLQMRFQNKVMVWVRRQSLKHPLVTDRPSED